MDHAKNLGLELRGRLFSHNPSCTASSATKSKSAEKENILKIMKLENRVNAQIDSSTAPLTPESVDEFDPAPPVDNEHGNLCVELLSMLKVRMDLVYAEIISRIGGTQALSVMTKASELPVTASASTPVPTIPTTPNDSAVDIESPLKLLKSTVECENESYSIVEEVHSSHHFCKATFEPVDKAAFFKAVQKEHKLLQGSLPPGVWVRWEPTFAFSF